MTQDYIFKMPAKVQARAVRLRPQAPELGRERRTMSEVTHYHVENVEGETIASFDADYRAAREHARSHEGIVVATEYEFSDSYEVDGDDYSGRVSLIYLVRELGIEQTTKPWQPHPPQDVLLDFMGGEFDVRDGYVSAEDAERIREAWADQKEGKQ